MHNYLAVIFDLDGTLVDSIADIADAMNRTLIQFNYPIHNYESYKYMVGNGLKKLVYQCLPIEHRNEERVASCLEVMMQVYGENYANKTVLYEGISELLNALSSQNIKMAILSNKADELTQKICSRLLNQWKFDVILGATEQFPRKPDPEAALFIAEKIGVSPRDVLYLGDTNVDMKTANNAGFYPVGVSWGFRTREELEANGAKQIINRAEEVLQLLNISK